MAVHKSRKTRSRKGMKRAHKQHELSAVSFDPTSGEAHRRHHLTADGYYRGKQVIQTRKVKKSEAEPAANE
jgi:large subunit ribosomal protein L32